MLLADIEAEFGIKLRVLVDVIAGASAGGINGIFLGQAITSGQSLEPSPISGSSPLTSRC